MGWLQLIGMGVSLLGQHKGGVANSAAANTQAGQIEQAGYQQADKIRRLGRRAYGEARAGLSASGVTGAGSPDYALDEMTRDTEADAFNTILSGKRQAGAVRSGLSAAESANRYNMASTLISGLGDYYNSRGGRWKTSSGVGANG